MSRAPLRLETYFFPKVQIEANPEYSPEAAPAEQDIELGVNLGLVSSKEQPTKYQLMLDIEKITVKSGMLPYRILLEAVAIFSVDPDLKHPDIKKLVQINGASMLYSAARELILTITGRGPWGSFQLPTVNFLGAISGSEKAKKGAEKIAPDQNVK